MLMLPPSVMKTVPARDGALAYDATIDLHQQDTDTGTVVTLSVGPVKIGTVVIADDHPDPLAALEGAMDASWPTYQRGLTRRRRLLHG